MNIKDLLAVLRRRVGWFVIFLLGSLGVYGGLLVSERPPYRASARIIIEIPEAILTGQEIHKRLWLTPITVATWRVLAMSTEARQYALSELHEKGYPELKMSDIDAQQIVEEETLLSWLQAAGKTPQQAVDIANAVARGAEKYGKEHQTKNIDEAISEGMVKAGKNQNEIVKLEAIIAEKDAEASSRGLFNLSPGYETIISNLELNEKRQFEIRQAKQAIALSLKELREDRLAAAHVLEGAIPIAPMDGVLRPVTSTRIESLEERVAGLQRKYITGLKKYYPSYPYMLELQAEIREAEAEAAEARRDAYGKDLDKVEWDFLSNDRALASELRVLENTAVFLRGKRDELAQAYKEYSRAKALVSALGVTNAALDANREALRNLKDTREGYVKFIEQARLSRTSQDIGRIKKALPIGLILAVMIGLAAAYLREYADSSIKSDYDIRRHLNFPVITAIPVLTPKDVLLVGSAGATVLAEIYDRLATLLQATAQQRPLKSILIGSPNPKEGKTTLSINLAIALARQGKKTLVIDGDLRIPSINHVLNLSNDVGLSNLLSNTVEPTEQGGSRIIREVGIDNLKVLTSGPTPQNPYTLLEPQRLHAVISELKQHFDFLIIDTPPLLLTGDALKYAVVADAVLYVIEAHRTDQREATWAKKLLENVGSQILGVILNKAKTEGEQYYYYYGYRYKYNYYKSTREA